MSIYIHIPFCRTRCYYCDFNTYAGLGNLIQPYSDAVEKEIQIVSGRIEDKPPVHTIFFGGGTPSVVPAEQIVSVIDQIKRFFHMIESAEISMEMNPTLLTEDYLSRVMKGGVNRISLGMQTASLEELRMLGRKHRFDDVVRSVAMVRAGGVENVNLDIIFGLPGQGIESFEKTLDAALEIRPPHFSFYALTVEEGTPLAAMIQKGELPEPDPDLAADMYALAMDRLDREGYGQYEISNWAIDNDHRCKHNLQYWKNKDYLGFGAGAHSHYSQRRWENFKIVSEYIQKLKECPGCGVYLSPAASTQIKLNRNDDLGETMMMGLRLTHEGVSDVEFTERFGTALNEIYKDEIEVLIQQKLLEWTGDGTGRHLQLTKWGRMLGNQVFMRFLRDQ